MTPQDWRYFAQFLFFGAVGTIAAFYGPTWLVALAFLLSGFALGEICV